MDATAARALDHVRRVVKAIHSHSVAIEVATGLSGPQFWALKEVAGVPDGLTLGELAERLALHKANAGRLADRLARRRLVRRETPAADRRVVRVKVTRRGLEKAELPVSAPPQADLLARLAELPASELQAIERALARLVELLGAAADEPGLMFDERAS